MIKCYNCKYSRQVGWDYFCIYKEFSLKYKMDMEGYRIKEIPKWCPLNTTVVK